MDISLADVSHFVGGFMLGIWWPAVERGKGWSRLGSITRLILVIVLLAV